MQQGIKKLQWCEYLKLVFLEILNPLLCRVFANQVTYYLVISYSYLRKSPCCIYVLKSPNLVLPIILIYNPRHPVLEHRLITLI